MTSGSEIQWGMPAWTAAMYPRKTGMDHLGLASVSQDRVLPELSPGVNVLTVHPRYWSVYSWLLTEFWDRDLPRTNAAWGRFLKPRERIFVAAVLSCPRHGADIAEVAGKLRIRKEVDQEVAAFDPSAPYLKNARGGYPIYASAIAQLGLTSLSRDLNQAACDAPTPYGRMAALELRSWVADTRYFRDHFDDPDTRVPADVVLEYAEKVCLCRATDGPDHPYLIDSFLHGGTGEEPIRRRSSLQLICDLADQTKADPVSPWEFRQFIYYRADLEGRSFQPSSPTLIDIARRWRLYQHRELVAWTFNRWLRQIWCWGLEHDGDRAPLSMADVLSSVDTADFAGLATELGVDHPAFTVDSPLEELLEWSRTHASVSTDLDLEWNINAPACEEHLLDIVWDLDRSDGTSVAAIIAMIVTCAARLWPLDHQLRYADDWHLVRAGGRRRLAVDRVVSDLRSHVSDGQSIAQSAKWFLEHDVIRQHHRTALAKLPDDTFRLRLDVERVNVIPEPIAVEFNDSRFRALSTCAAELGLIRPIGEPKHTLSKSGRSFLKHGDLPATFPEGALA